MRFRYKKSLQFYTYNLLVSLVLFALTLIPFFSQINQLFIDQLHGRIPARKEIAIVAIDDKSLQEIGAWPWDRSVFAKVITQLSDAGARVIGIDVLFLEKRSGDDQMAEALANSKAPVVLSEKLLASEKKTEFPFYQLPKEQFGFINFNPDADGKVRSTYMPGAEKALNQTSFSFRILQQYFSEKFVSEKLTKQYPNNTSQLVFFNFTHYPFTQVSLSDVLNNRVDTSVFKDKIVLIGTSTIDLKSGINDNLTDIFGESTPGIVVHANIINSFLENRFQHTFPVVYTFLGTLLLTLVFSFIFRQVRSNIVDLIISIASFLLINLIGFLVFDLGINWPFLTFSTIILFTYISSLAQKYIMENQQRRFIQMAFTQYINPALMKQLMANPEILKLGGEKRVMTVMFSDVRGFTTLSEKLPPEELISLLNSYLDDMCEIVLEEQGTIDKFIGDAIMALWNAPLDDPDHQHNALKTAMRMVDALSEFNKKHTETPLNIGIGLNTGDMVVGNIGSKRRFDYTVLGDNVNLSSRVEGLTKKYGVLVLATEATIEGIDDSEIIFRMIDQVIVKGKSKPIKLFQPLPNSEENAKLKKTYEQAFSAYAKGQFSEAKKIWATLPSDPTSNMMIERLDELKETKNWKGVWEWHEK